MRQILYNISALLIYLINIIIVLHMT